MLFILQFNFKIPSLFSFTLISHHEILSKTPVIWFNLFQFDLYLFKLMLVVTLYNNNGVVNVVFLSSISKMLINMYKFFVKSKDNST